VLVDLAQNTLDGLDAGASYALLALGFTLVFGVLRLANLAYGPAIMLGTYAATWASLHYKVGLPALAAITVGATVLAGAYVERLCFAPHRLAPHANQGRPAAATTAMVASFAVWMQFEEAATIALPRHLYAFPPLTTQRPLPFGPLLLRFETLVSLAVAASLCAALWWVLYRARFGLGVRAVIERPAAAGLAGIDVSRVSAAVFMLASAMGGAAGFLVAVTHGQVTPHLGMWATLKGMLAMMIGGLGSLPGAVVGGVLLGVLEAHSQWYLGPQARDLVAYLLLFVLLALRPHGLLPVRRPI
jgi:branched-chain amino acid transport system permease protein